MKEQISIRFTWIHWSPLLLIPLFLFASACSDNPVDTDPPDNGDNGGDNPNATVYDTTNSRIVVDDLGEGTGTVTWTSDYIYELDDKVFVNDGQTLTIEAGTRIEAQTGTGEEAAALVVARGASILADGEQDDSTIDPIIFTSALDDGTLGPDDRGLWGGVVILGNATLNSEPGETAIEGIPTSEERGLYGGSDDGDDSGVFRYVSIRHGGAEIGAGNELNGLTMGGVGSSTTIEYVEVYANDDDGFEWFGGTVDTKYLVAAYCEDDAFDIDEGFRGRGQFFLSVYTSDAGNYAGEHDGGTDPEDGQPYAAPQFSNVTYIGSGENSSNDANELVLYMRDNFAGSYYNSIFMDFPANGLEIEDNPSGEDSRARFQEGTLQIQNNFWHKIGGQETFEELIRLTEADGDPVDASFHTELADYLRAENNRLNVDPMLVNVAREDGGLDPRLSAESPARGAFEQVNDRYADRGPFFDDVDFVGAFDDAMNWAAGWTKLFEN